MTKKRKSERDIGWLANRLGDKDYVDYLICNKDYKLKRKEGEIDILSKQGKRKIYWELKSNYTDKTYRTAVKQVLRCTGAAKKYNSDYDYYGIYYVRNTICKIVCKNGQLR